MSLFKEEKEKPNLEFEELKKQLLSRISTMNDSILDLRGRIEEESTYSKTKIEHIEKTLNLLDEDIFEVSEKINKKTEHITKASKNIIDLKIFAKLALKNKDLVDKHEEQINFMNKTILEIKDRIKKREIVIPAGDDTKKSFAQLQNQINDLKSRTLIVEKPKKKTKTN